jgi:hypothetical protein
MTVGGDGWRPFGLSAKALGIRPGSPIQVLGSGARRSRLVLLGASSSGEAMPARHDA